MNKKIISTLMCLLMCTVIGSQTTAMAIEESTQVDDVLTSNIDYSNHDLTLLYLGDNVYLKLLEDYQTYSPTSVYYLENSENDVYSMGDIVGVNLNVDNEETRDYVKNFILESSYTMELIQSSEPQALFEEGEEVPVFFGSIDSVYNEHCVEVRFHNVVDGIDSFLIFNEEPLFDGYTRGDGIVFTIDELYSYENIPMFKSNFIADEGNISGISCGYNSTLDATLIRVSSSGDDNIGNYVYLYGVDVNAGYTVLFYYLEPFVYVEDNLYIADFYEVSSISDFLSLEKDTSQSISKTAEVLGRYTDNGAYVKLTDNDYPTSYIYLVNDIPENVEVGDIISFDLLNSIHDHSASSCYYAENVSIVEKQANDMLVGDVNLDGTVDILDLLTLKNAILNSRVSIVEGLPENANINRDLSVNTMDLFLLKRMILNLG